MLFYFSKRLDINKALRHRYQSQTPGGNGYHSSGFQMHCQNAIERETRGYERIAERAWGQCSV